MSYTADPNPPFQASSWERWDYNDDGDNDYYSPFTDKAYRALRKNGLWGSPDDAETPYCAEVTATFYRG